MMGSCPKLTSCMDLEYWEQVTSEELANFTEYLRTTNIRLKTVDDKESGFESMGGLCTTANLPENMLCDGY